MPVEEQTYQDGTSSTYGGGKDGQRLIINDRIVSALAFYIRKVGDPIGDVTFTIRKVSDDSIIVSKVWGDASDLEWSLTWEEVVFGAPIRIQDEVRIALEFDGGDEENLVRSGRSISGKKGGECYTYWDSPGGTEWIDYDGDFCYKYTYTLPPDEFTIDIGFDIGATAYEWQRKDFKNPRGLGYYYALIKAPASTWKIHKSLDGSSWSIAANSPEISTEEPPALCICEDEANTRLIVYLVYKSGWYIFAFAKTIEDDSSDFTSVENFWWEQVAERTEDGVYFPNICIDNGGYLWVSWTDVYGKEDHAQIRVARSTASYPTSAPGWDLATIYGEPGGEFGSKGLDFGTGPMPRSELVPLTATADVAIVMGYYDDAASAYGLDGMTLTYSAGIQEGAVVDFSDLVNSDLLHSSVAEDGPNSDVFIGYKDYIGYFLLRKWDISEASSAAFGTISYDFYPDSLALAIDKNASPNKLYAFYVKNGVPGDVFYNVTEVDEFSLEGEIKIDDDTQSLDYLSASYQDWALDGDVQVIYTRQTWRRVRFWATGPAVSIDPPTVTTQDATGIGKGVPP